MARLRKKSRKGDDVEPEPTPPEESVPDVRADGPWDSSEKSPGDDPGYVDLGPLMVRGGDGYTLQLPTDSEKGEIGSVVLVAEDAALELRAFAATRSGGLWDDVRADLVEEVERLGGETEEVSGHYGPELHVRMPATTDDGEEGFQPSRILGIEGPRWLLRATLLGQAALSTDVDGLLMSALRDVIVVRGADPRMLREPLLLTLPDNAVLSPDED